MLRHVGWLISTGFLKKKNLLTVWPWCPKTTYHLTKHYILHDSNLHRQGSKELEPLFCMEFID